MTSSFFCLKSHRISAEEGSSSSRARLIIDSRNNNVSPTGIRNNYQQNIWGCWQRWYAPVGLAFILETEMNDTALVLRQWIWSVVTRVPWSDKNERLLLPKIVAAERAKRLHEATGAATLVKGAGVKLNPNKKCLMSNNLISNDIRCEGDAGVSATEHAGEWLRVDEGNGRKKRWQWSRSLAVRYDNGHD